MATPPMLFPQLAAVLDCFWSGEEWEKLGEVCILNNVDMVLEAVNNQVR